MDILDATRRPYTATVVDPARPWTPIHLAADTIGLSIGPDNYHWADLSEPEVQPITGFFGTRFAVTFTTSTGNHLRLMFPARALLGYNPARTIDAAHHLRALRAGHHH